MEWLRMFAGYSFVQAVAQGVGFIAGILTVRTLPKSEYACLMIVNTIGPLMGTLSDTGINNSLSALGGKFWDDDSQMGALVKTAMRLRRALFLWSSAAVGPVLAWMLWKNHAAPWTIVWLVAITMIGVFFQLNVGVLTVVLSLRQQISRMQTLVFLGSVPRLALIALLAGVGILTAPLAAACAALALAGQALLLKRWVKPQVAWEAPPSAEYRRGILAIVRKQAPITIYFCLQSQIGVWLISIFGTVGRVADVGALGRISLIFAVLVQTSGALIVPRFARCQDPARLRSLYRYILAGFACLFAAGLAFAAVAPEPFLWLLGPQYANLRNLVWLAVLGAGTTSFWAVLNGLNTNRGWIPAPYIVIPAEVTSQVILCLVFGLSSVRGILWITALAPVAPVLINIVVGVKNMRKLAREQGLAELQELASES